MFYISLNYLIEHLFFRFSTRVCLYVCSGPPIMCKSKAVVSICYILTPFINESIAFILSNVFLAYYY